MKIQDLIEKQKKLKLNENPLLSADQVSMGEDEDVADESVLQLVSFTLDEVEYGIDILLVHEILRMHELTRLPNTPDFIKGVINLRGNVIPVVDMRKRFGFAETEETDLTRIIVVQSGDKQAGLLVDNVYQVVRVHEANIDEPSDLIEGSSSEFVSGIGRLRDRLIIILNITNILFTEEELQQEHIQIGNASFAMG